MHSFVRAGLVFVCLLALFFVGGCGWGPFRAKERKAQDGSQKTPAPHMVGTITLVNEEERFVLIDNGSQPPPPSGAALKAFTSGTESAVLSVGSVRRRPFVIADIVKGAPKKGDEVFQ
jgi:hypothetical protein